MPIEAAARAAARRRRSDEARTIRGPLGRGRDGRHLPGLERGRAAPTSARWTCAASSREVMRCVPFQAALGLRIAVWIVALAPLFVLGRLATIVGLAPGGPRDASSRRWWRAARTRVRSLVLILKTMGALLYAGDDARARAHERAPAAASRGSSPCASKRAATPSADRGVSSRCRTITTTTITSTPTSPTSAARGQRRRRQRPSRATSTTSFDYVVVGSGAAGAVAAHTLAKAGFSVAIVEEGPWVKTREFGERVYDAFRAHVPRLGHAGARGARVHPAHPGAVRRRQHGDELGHRAPHAGGRARRVGRALRPGRAHHGRGARAALRRARARAQRARGGTTTCSARTTASSSTRRRRGPARAQDAPLRARLPRLGPLRDRLPQRAPSRG